MTVEKRTRNVIARLSTGLTSSKAGIQDYKVDQQYYLFTLGMDHDLQHRSTLLLPVHKQTGQITI